MDMSLNGMDMSKFLEGRIKDRKICSMFFVVALLLRSIIQLRFPRKVHDILELDLKQGC